jgi:Txe/YoeB family toxin of Txe-Axe toxin-antitoxin module
MPKNERTDEYIGEGVYTFPEYFARRLNAENKLILTLVGN